MNCNCNRQTTAIKWIRGNFFPYVLSITRHDTDGTVDGDGNLIWTVTDYQVMPEDEVSVVFKGSTRSYNMDFTIDANGHLVIEDNGEMPNGVYSIEVNITANDIDGMRRRWMIKNAVQLCESLTQEEMHATTLQADVFWFAKGDTGNGIEGVTLTDTVIDTETGQRTRTYTISFTDSEDIIITLTDIDFDIFMDKIIDLIGQVQVNVIPYITEGTKIAKVAGTDIYSPSTPTYDEVPTSGSNNPVKSQGIKSALDTLDGKINAIIGGNATLSLSVSPASIFTNTSASVTVTATASMQATSINIKKGGTVVQSGGNTTSINYTETVTLSSGETITYSAEGVISGITKTVSNKTVRAYDKIYYGVGTENNYSGITTYQSIRTNAAGTYTFNITSEKQYAYILEPYAMAAINLNNVKLDSGFGYNLQLISDNATIDNARYRVYRSAANAAGESFNVVIS